jgi:DNA-binding NarL/FixJ family response regulator
MRATRADTSLRGLAVAVADAAPSYRRGLLAALADAGAVPADPQDIRAWAAGQRRCAVLLTLSGPADVRRASALRSPTTLVVALLPDPDAESFLAALRAEVDGVADWRAPPEEVVAVVSAAAEGQVHLPAGVARELATAVLRPPATVRIDPREAAWLRDLAGGVTVAQLARRAGYTERALYRLLHRLYARMGAESRVEALLLATRWGLLDGTSPGGAPDGA